MPQNWCKDINFLSTIILGTWGSLGAHSSLFAEINLSVILIVGGLFVLFKIPQGAGSSSLFTDCPSRISRMWQRQSEKPQPESSVKPDTARPVPEERGRGWNFFCLHFAKAAINCARGDSLFGLARPFQSGSASDWVPNS